VKQAHYRTHDEAFVDIVKGIRRSIQDLQKSTSRAEGNDGTYSTRIDPNGQHDHLESDAIVQVIPALPPPANPGLTNICFV